MCRQACVRSIFRGGCEAIDPMSWMDIVDTILSPLGCGLILALILWRFRGRSPRWLWRAGFVVELACLAMTTPLGASALIAIQEKRAPTPQACAAPQPSVVVLLAGGVRRLPIDARDVDALSAASVRRTIAAATLLRGLPDARLVISGTGRGRNGAGKRSDGRHSPARSACARTRSKSSRPRSRHGKTQCACARWIPRCLRASGS